MDIIELKNEGLSREYKVVVSHQDVDSQVLKRLGELSLKVKMDGFRAGKVPMPMLKQRYGQSTFMEVVNEMVQAGVGKVLTDNNLTPAMQPQISMGDLKEGKDFDFTVAFEITPTVEPKAFDHLKIEKYKVKISEAEIDEQLAYIAERNFLTQPLKKQRPAKKGDVVIINFVGRLENGKAIEGGSGDNFSLELGSGSFIPGFEDQLEGAKLGDKIEVKLNFPDQYHEKSLAGQGAVFDVTVNEIQEKKPAVVGEELAKKVGFESLDELRKGIHDDIEQNHASLVRTHMKRQLLDALAEAHDFQVPSGMVDIEFSGIWQQLQHALKHAESREDVLGEDAEASEAELMVEYRKIAERRVRLGLLLAEIGRLQKISITPDELRQAIFNEARRYPGQEKQIFEYYGKSNEALTQLRAPLFEEKVVDYIFSVVNVFETEIESKELMNKIESL